MHRIAYAAAIVTGLLAHAAQAQMTELAPVEDDESAVSTPGETPAASSEPIPVILEEFEVDERDVVLSAARTRTTIQEAPGIITVVTAEEIRQRGHRTVNEVLRTVPGFEGGRFQGNNWFNESIARGQPRTLLILINGVNATEPVRNSLTLDHKIPIDAIKRIEITSGPGGVLWGSNALLGVINIILKDSADLDGLEVRVGGGHGSASQGAMKTGLSYGGDWLDGKVRVFSSLDFYSDQGAELTVDTRKVIGVLPEPQPDGLTVVENTSGVTDFNSRDWWLASTLSVQLFDTITLDWMLQFEQDYRQIATGGALLEGALLDESGKLRRTTAETLADDSIQTVGLSWRDRFLEDKLGINAKIYGVRFRVAEDPFWAFPPRSLPGVSTALEKGVVINIDVKQMFRFGANVDADLNLGDHRLLFGGEVVQERLRNSGRGDVLRGPALLPGLREPDAMDPLVARGVFSPQRCPPKGRHDVQLRDRNIAIDFKDNCAFRETLILDSNRTVAAAYLSDLWRPHPSLAVQPGYRLQISDTYDAVSLFSGALVWNLIDKVYLKINYAEGFRPPELQATRINPYPLSGLGFEPDPNLKVEQSRATETELNAILLEDVGPLRRIFLRADYAYTVLTDVVRNSAGQFVNSGKRGIHSVEFLARADFKNKHELFFGGHFIRTEDSISGPVRNFPNWILMGGGRLRLLDDHLELSTLATFVGAQEDLNRATDLGTPRLDSTGDGKPNLSTVDPGKIEVDLVDRYVLLRVGFRVLNLWEDRLELSGFAYNAANVLRADPDFFFDDRVATRSQPRGGWSAFAQATVRFF